MPDAPWKDALKRARDPASAPRRVASARLPASSSALDPATVSPELARLMEERRALEARMTGLAGAAGPSDPRYAVTPLDQRRAELARWSAGRDAGRAALGAAALAGRAVTPPAPNPALRATPGETARGGSDPALRATPGESVRPTPGGLPPDLRRVAAPLTELFERPAPTSRERPREKSGDKPRERASANAEREADPRAEASRRLAAIAESGRALRDAGRALRTPEDRPRNGPGDPLDRRLERARDMVSRGRKAYAAAERSLDAAREAIPRDWVERAREKIPGLGRADPYVRETARKLAVVVGTIDELTDKADQMREMARDVRELREADESHDDARRERALEKLKAKRADEARDNPQGED